MKQQEVTMGRLMTTTLSSALLLFFICSCVVVPASTNALLVGTFPTAVVHHHGLETISASGRRTRRWPACRASFSSFSSVLRTYHKDNNIVFFKAPIDARLYQQRTDTSDSVDKQANRRKGRKPKQQRRKYRKWEESFELIRLYKEENGNCKVPIKYKEDPLLGNWVSTQRAAYKNGTLKEERRVQLEAIGFVWSVIEVKRSWDESYQTLVEFKSANGHCNVPFLDPKHEVLARWISHQRQHIEKLSTRQKSKLDQIGFSWNLTRPWEELYEELVEYRDEHGDCNVPRAYAPNIALSRWVFRQRQQKAVLSKSQRRMLNEIEFTWENSAQERSDKRWYDQLEKLKKYQRKHGHCRVPTATVSLGGWVRSQRASYRSGQISKDRINKLNEIGFEWRLRDYYGGIIKQDVWLDRYQELQVFQEDHGHGNVPHSYNATLARWVRQQRNNYCRDRLLEDRKTLLEKIGFEWNVQEKLQDEQWADSYLRFKTIADSCGDQELSPVMKTWAQRQRIAHANEKLKPERKALLDEMGFNMTMGAPYIGTI